MTTKDKAIKEALDILEEGTKLQTHALKLLKIALGLPEQKPPVHQAVVTSIHLVKQPEHRALLCTFCKHEYPYHNAGCAAGATHQAHWLEASAAHSGALTPQPQIDRSGSVAQADQLDHVGHVRRIAPVIEFRSPLSSVVGEG